MAFTPARKIICPAPRATERLSLIWVKGCHTSLVKEVSNKNTIKQTGKKKQTKTQIPDRSKKKRKYIWQGILLILYGTNLNILLSLINLIYSYSILIIVILPLLLLFYLFNILFNFIDIFFKNLSVLSPKSFKVMQRLGSLSVWLQYLREVGI